MFRIVAKLTSGSEKAYGWELSEDLEPVAEGIFNNTVAIAGDFDAFTALVAEASGYEIENLAAGADFSEAANQLAWEVSVADHTKSV